jgi:ATP/maltotriose-dependent transcriptional regulator MalT
MAKAVDLALGGAEAMLPRRRLVDAVLSTPPGGVCLISSDPGYGRRTLLRMALGRNASVLRLPASPLADDSWRGLLAGVVGPGAGDGDPAAVRAALEGAADPWLVLLDLDPALHPQALSLLLGLLQQVGRLRVAVVSSATLGGRLTRARLDGLVADVDQSDLALEPHEARSLLVALAPGLAEDSVADIVDLCDGWAAALVATARWHVARPGADVVAWLRGHGAELLVSPWLDAQGTDVLELLLDTAVLDRLTPQLVDAVVDRPVGRLLRSLARPNGMVRVAWDRPGDELVWFLRHPLLTAYLRFAAAGRAGEAERHRRAASWFRDHRDLGRELEHRILAGDTEVAAGIMERNENRLFESGLAQVALRWYLTSPDPHEPVVQLLREGWAAGLSGRMVDAADSLGRLRALLRQSPEPAMFEGELRDFVAEADVLDAWLGEQDGDAVRVVVNAGQARARFASAWSLNSHQLAALLHARGAVLLDDEATADGILTSIRDAPFSAAVLGEGRRAAAEAELAWSRGLVHEARAWSARYERWYADQSSAGVVIRYGPCMVSGLCRAEAGDIDGAVALLERAVEHAEAVTGNVTDLVLSRLALAEVLAAARRLPQAFEQASAARAVVLERAPSGGLLPRVVRAEAALRLDVGDVVRAERLIRLMPQGLPRQLLSARLALLRSTPSAAVLVREIDPATPRQRIEHAVLSAWALLGTSPGRSEQALLHAADIAGQVGITTALVHVPAPLLEHASRVASHHVHDPLIALVRQAERGRHDAPAGAPGADVVLTRGDLQLLALLPSRMSNGGIADELGVSVNTIKTRLRRLYTKLGVHDRDGAVSRGRELGLLKGRGAG